jgi:hypothetical protein
MERKMRGAMRECVRCRQRRLGLLRRHAPDFDGRIEGVLRAQCVRSENLRSEGNLLESPSPSLENPALPPAEGFEGDDEREGIIDMLLDVW